MAGKCAKLIILLSLFCCPLEICGAGESYFYKGQGFGSEALFNPVSLVLNGGYGILTFDGHTREVAHLPYRAGADNIWRNLSDPFGPIDRYGWGNFIRHEILPLSLNKKGAQWLPNYKLHLIGGGMSYRMTSEWYEYHSFPHPKLMSMATMGVYHYLNEVVENGSYIGDNVDPIADLYFFDVGGIILFSFDGVCEFFSKELNLSDWSAMPSFRVRDLSIQNHGQNFSARWKTPFSEKWRLFYYFGNIGLPGLSYSLPDNKAISFGAGIRAKSQELLDENTHKLTVKLVWTAGIFYDKNNSLLGSLQLSGMEGKFLNLNIYPGMVQIGKFSPGLWLNIDRHGGTIFGFTTVWAPGIAVN